MIFIYAYFTMGLILALAFYRPMKDRSLSDREIAISFGVILIVGPAICAYAVAHLVATQSIKYALKAVC